MSKHLELSKVKTSVKKRGKKSRHLLKASTVLKLMSARKLSSKHSPPRRQLWGKLIGDRMLGMIHGPRGGGKTFFVLSLAIAIAAGLEFLGHKPKRPSKVVMLDGEMGFRLMRERLRTVSKALGTPPPENLLLLNPDLFDGILPSLATAEGQAEIDALIDDDVDVIVVDNFSCWNRGGREDAEGWTAWNTWMLAHKRKGRTVIVVHHTGKNGEQRGTSKREDSLDFVIGLKPGDNEEFPDALSFDLTWTKSRHLKREQASRIRATLVDADDDKSRWVFDLPPSAKDRAAEARALSAEGLNQTQIAVRMGVNKSSVCRMLKGGGGRK